MFIFSVSFSAARVHRRVFRCGHLARLCLAKRALIEYRVRAGERAISLTAYLTIVDWVDAANFAQGNEAVPGLEGLTRLDLLDAADRH